MNTLSSLLNWIGSFIGANPNTLTTSSKTIVGAINEVKSGAVPTSSLTETGESGKVPKITSDGKLKVPSIEINNNALADFVVEQGTSGDNFYRKWNSGTAECWAYTSQNVAINTSYGSLYIGAWTWTFPLTFTAPPTVVCSDFKWGTSASWAAISSATTTSADIRAIDAYSRASGSCVIAAYAIGKWK